VSETRVPDDNSDPASAPDRSGLGVRVALVIAGIAVIGVIAAMWTPSGSTSPGPDTGGGAPVGAEPVVEEQRPAIILHLVSALDDRFMSEPCNRIPGGGLFSVRAVTDMIGKFMPNKMTVLMGDLSLAPGPVGRLTTEFHYQDVLVETGVDIVAAGEGELGHGTEFVREVLASPSGYTVLCANALDSSGYQILRGWSLMSVGGRNVLTVAVAGESVGYELVRRGSDVALGPPVAAVTQALAEGLERAADAESPTHTKLLLVHGTLAEAEAILREVSGFDVAVAADGPILPELTPRQINGTPLYYAGRGARFSWSVYIDDEQPEPFGRLGRLGGGMIARGSPYGSRLAAIRGTVRHELFGALAQSDDRPIDPRGEFVGGESCAECHPVESADHARGPHARAPEELLNSDFSGSTGCLSCHVTAPYNRGGWVPDAGGSGLDGIACESFHGPGAEHAAMPGPGYGRIDYARCYDCHLPDRNPELDARAAWELSGHGAPPAPPDLPPDPDEGDDDTR